MISISVEGDPVPKGSMRAFVMRTKSGRYTSRVTHDNKRTKPWQEQLEGGIRSAMDSLEIGEPIDEPVIVECTFFLRKPKSAKRSHPSVKPDLDKLQRVVGDALEGTLLTNDSRIVEWVVGKVYGEKPGVIITVSAVDAFHVEQS